MGHTYTNLMYHCVFSTKERRPFLTDEVMSPLIRYIGGIVRKRGGKLLCMNGTEDHVHLLVLLSAKRALSDDLRDIKAVSSGWIHDTFPELRDFSWQEGYGAFTVSKSNVPEVRRYIESQPEHHKKKSFEDELLSLLKKHGIEYDPRYVFD